MLFNILIMCKSVKMMFFLFVKSEKTGTSSYAKLSQILSVMQIRQSCILCQATDIYKQGFRRKDRFLCH